MFFSLENVSLSFENTVKVVKLDSPSLEHVLCIVRVRTSRLLRRNSYTAGPGLRWKRKISLPYWVESTIYCLKILKMMYVFIDEMCLICALTHKTRM